MKFKRSSDFAVALSILREQVARADFLPGTYARYRPLLANALHFFLERLPENRLRALLAEQLSLPRDFSTSQRVLALLHRVPVLHKLGQVMARDRRLSPDFRARLQELESIPSRCLRNAALRLLDQHLPGWQGAQIECPEPPLAEGSVAVVMPFIWKRARMESHHGVFKLLKPDIQEHLEQDLAILGQLGKFLEQDCERYALPKLDYAETFETIRDLLMHEVRLEEEQRHLVSAAETFASHPSVVIPRLLPFCSHTVTAMERVHGVKISTAGPSDKISQRQIALLVAEAMVAEPLFSRRAAAAFHADPHAGNLLQTPEGKVGILDWSLVGELRKEPRVALVQVVLAAATLDPERALEAILCLARPPTHESLVRDTLERHLGAVRWGNIPTTKWITELLDDLVLRARLKVDSNLLLLRKCLLTLKGVLADIVHDTEEEAQLLLDQAILAAFLRHWTSELPARFFAPFNSRAFSTHLSTWDVLATLLSAPATVAKWHQGIGLDLLWKLGRSQAASKVIN